MSKQDEARVAFERYESNADDLLQKLRDARTALAAALGTFNIYDRLTPERIGETRQLIVDELAKETPEERGDRERELMENRGDL